MNTASVTRAFARNASESAYPNLWRGLVAAWLPPGAPKHPTRLIDYSGNGNHGTLQNGTSWDIGKNGRCMNFDGVDDDVIGDTPGKNFPIGAESRTVACWARTPMAWSGDKGILHWGTDGAAPTAANFHLVAGTGGTILWGNGYGHGILSGNIQINDGRWHHIAGSYDSSNGLASIYVDGRIDQTGTYSNSPSTGILNNWRIGQFINGFGSFPGEIESCYVFRRCLRQSEIRILASAGLSVKRCQNGVHLRKWQSSTTFAFLSC